ncbi:MAG: DUF2845 domain-containing protein [Gammaproteobacteria bacterium]
MRALVAYTLLAAFAPAAWAGDTLRCGDRVVSTEDLAAEVLAACGDPDYRDQWLQPPASSCAPTEIVRGLSAFRLVHRCGRPVTRETFDELRPLHRKDAAYTDHAARPVRRERWVYDFGAGSRMRVVTLNNGKVTDVDSGERGGY